MKLLHLAFFTFIIFQVQAQKVFEFGNSLPVRIAGRSLSMPFAGGINAAQIQQLDINNDGLQEWVVWDKNAGNLSVFEISGNSYLYRPDLRYYFPADINGFLLLADYDGDGKKDLFTSSSFGIKAYKNRSSADLPQWEVAQEFLKLDNQSNLQTNSLDIPSIKDIDGDGDLDIVTFNFASGDFLEYYQNTSVERKGSPDIDGFAKAVTRWGGFEFCGCGDFSFDQTCDGNPMTHPHPEGEDHKIQHAGGHSILMHDVNGDGTLDLLMGQDECSTLYVLPNEGTNAFPDFNAFSRDLPQLGPLPEFPVFHAANLLGQDLVITSNSSHVASHYNSDYSQSLYHYKQGKTLTTQAFLQEDMLDLGENSRPFFKGNAASGELIVTANSLVDQKIVGKAFHFTLSSDGLTLDEEDFLSFSSLNLTDLQYQEVLNADHRPSLFLSGVETINFTAVRKLFWTSSMDGLGLQEITLPGIQMAGNDHFEFYTHQGTDFLLLARQTGELLRYQVHFGAVPEMVLLDRNYLGFSDDAAHRNLSVHQVGSAEGKQDLFVVDQNGLLAHLEDYQNGIDPNIHILQIGESDLRPTLLGRNTWIASIPSAFGDTRDLILGNTSGGLIYLKDSSPNSGPSDKDLRLKVYPNPSIGPLNILSSQSGLISLMNTLGQVVMADILIGENIPLEIHTQHLSKGVYILQLISNSGERSSQKIILTH